VLVVVDVVLVMVVVDIVLVLVVVDVVLVMVVVDIVLVLVVVDVIGSVLGIIDVDCSTNVFIYFLMLIKIKIDRLCESRIDV
jgi:hypothetical protein